MLSIWERNHFIHYDHIVLGSGIVGLCAAYYIQLKYPSHRVLILERGLMPTGASTKNAGFACMGSASELMEDLKTMSEQQMIDLFLLRRKGLERLKNLLGEKNIDYQTNGSHELITQKEEAVLDDLEYLNKLLIKETGQEAFKRSDKQIEKFGFEKSSLKGMIENTCEGEIDTGWMMRNLIQLVLKSGIEIKTGCQVNSFHDTGQGAEVVCFDPITFHELVFQCKTLCICNNAFAAKLLPDFDIQPGRGQVLITKPVLPLQFQGIFHIHQGYYYFRAYKGCVLFGGGRNLDKATENTLSIELNESIQSDLINKLRHLILPNTTFEIDMQWAGIMAFGQTKQPIIEPYSKHIFIGVRMGGMGIAIGSEVGFALTDFI